MRSVILILAIALTLPVAAPAATALSPSLTPQMCVVSGMTASCIFTCQLGDVLSIFVQGTAGFDRPRAFAHCGSVSVECQQTGGCASTSSQTTVGPAYGSCNVQSLGATTTCIASPNPAGLPTALLPSCSVSGEGASCYFSCVQTQRIVVTAYSFAHGNAPASGKASCGDQVALCSGMGACQGVSAGRVGSGAGIGACRAYSGSTSVSCTSQL